MRQLASLGQIDYEPDKALLSVANRLGLTLDRARLVIRGLIGALTPEHFSEPGKGFPPPPCDAYLIKESHYDVSSGRWDDVEWYVKIGISYGANPALDLLWVESCHD